ncbi:VWA domain-containing protein [Chloroflexia bacterium SDU3-3]|nr:VWA domain-containing protein [Chloroflexia bacterium SDU3-3]
MENHDILPRRQVLYWRLLASLFGPNEQAQNIERMTGEIAQELGMPEALLDTRMGIDTLLQRFPELDAQIDLQPKDDEQPEATLARALMLSKLLLNAFGPNTMGTPITAAQYAQWMQDVGHLERAMGLTPGALRGRGAGAGGGGASTGGGHGGFDLPLDELQRTLVAMDGDLIKRMALREVLQDNRLAAQLQPSMALLEQLLRDKAHLSGNALVNAKRLIQQYVDELAEVLRIQVEKAVSPKIDRSVPPKRVFRNLDLDRTLWKNLTNWNEQEQRLYVDRLYYRQTARKKLPTRMIVVVDQSGSMVDAMVQCTILASIFAGLPHVDVHLLAFDTVVLDLTPWVSDPFEVLMRTDLGGGTHINKALKQAAEKIEDPRRTSVVLISDFYEGGSDQELLNTILSLKQSGVHFIPVGSVTSSGYFSVSEWFRTRLKDHGMPILTGSPKKLIEELKKVVVL